LRIYAILACILAGNLCLQAQDDGRTSKESDWGDKFWLSGQLNVVGQFYPPFPAAYSGPNSLDAAGQSKPTWVATIYTGYAPFQNTELLFDVESAKGSGVSGALGLGGLGNLDAVTDPTASAEPYIARAMVRQIIGLGRHRIEADRNPLSLSPTVPERRLEVRLGKMSLADFFDLNAVGSDSHLQFLNYAVDNNATYDIAANARGYTYAALAELYQPGWAFRFAEAFEPRDTSGSRTDWNISRSSSENAEIELHPNLKGKQPFTLRMLGFVNHAEMGDYAEAVQNFLAGRTSVPDLGPTVRPGVNWGTGLNGEAELSHGMRVFGRLGWNQGTREIFQFAETDRTISGGTDFDGRLWKQKKHRIGVAFASNGLTEEHRRYLELGGQSFLLGDGGLTYGRENVLEGYYNVPLFRGVFAAFDVQRVWNPGYNQNRGPVIIFGLRLHAEGDVHFH
jgi:high affinity Mn2+ porin